LSLLNFEHDPDIQSTKLTITNKAYSKTKQVKQPILFSLLKIISRIFLLFCKILLHYMIILNDNIKISPNFNIAKFGNHPTAEIRKVSERPVKTTFSYLFILY
jgi:hypothetical protein